MLMFASAQVGFSSRFSVFELQYKVEGEHFLMGCLWGPPCHVQLCARHSECFLGVYCFSSFECSIEKVVLGALLRIAIYCRNFLVLSPTASAITKKSGTFSGCILT